MTTSRNLSPERIDEIKKTPITYDDDSPKLTAKDFENGHFKNWKPAKKSITVRIDLDNLEWLKSKNPVGYQKRLNETLRWARQNGCPIGSGETNR